MTAGAISSGHRLDPDRDLEAVGSLLVRAARAIENADVRRLPTDGHTRDAFATKVQVMHVVHLTGHAAAVGLSRRSPADSAFLRRMEVPIGLALGYFQGSYPEALTETHRDWIDPDRLGTSVSAFDIQAHRVLSGDLTAGDLRDVANTMYATTTYAQALWRIAADAGWVDAREHRTRLHPALERSGSAWFALATTWDALTHPVEGRAGALQHTGVDLRTSFGELTRDRLGPATPQVVAARTDMGAALAALRQYHLSSVGIAGAFATATQHPALMVDARRASRMVTTMMEEGRLPEQTPAPVSPRSVYLKRPAPLPPVLARPAMQQSERAMTAARNLDQAVESIASMPTFRADSPIERIGPRPDPGRLRLVREQGQQRQTSGESRSFAAIDR